MPHGDFFTADGRKGDQTVPSRPGRRREFIPGQDPALAPIPKPPTPPRIMIDEPPEPPRRTGPPKDRPKPSPRPVGGRPTDMDEEMVPNQQNAVRRPPSPPPRIPTPMPPAPRPGPRVIGRSDEEQRKMLELLSRVSKLHPDLEVVPEIGSHIKWEEEGGYSMANLVHKIRHANEVELHEIEHLIPSLEEADRYLRSLFNRK